MDSWIRGQSLRELIKGPSTMEEMQLSIVDFWDNTDWKWESISFALPSSIKEKI